jgi:threonylcarbamoyladenosine tRNA methylthiotransferase MtaB
MTLLSEHPAAKPQVVTQVVTLGCRLNAHESDAIAQHAAAAGLENCVVVNTCAVTSEAVRTARHTIRRLKREQPGARVIVTGCAAQIEPATFAAMAEVDHVIGNAEKLKPETFTALALGDTLRVQVDDIMSVRETAGHLIEGFGARTRAYVQVQNGCDHRCTFCIIPFGRGPSRSVPAGDVVAAVRRAVEAGAHEVVLTGVDITSYGPDLPGTMTLGKLVRQIFKHVRDLPRLRLSSLDQTEIDPDLLAAIADEPRLMPHLHLSLQSGDDMILKRMKRRHLRADAIRFADEARRLRPDIQFGADLIAGFPTETEAMFQQSLAIVDDCGLSYLHVFPYSVRPGTPAARMPQIPKPEIKARAERLREKGRTALASSLARHVGLETEVLVERDGIGRTPGFAEVQLDRPLPGHLQRVRITSAGVTQLVGQVVS